MKLPKLDLFYVDRVWIKAYPRFFSNLRIKENMERYLEYRNTGVFSDMSETAFRLYRTLNCVKRGIAKFPTLDSSKCREILRYGEPDFYDFRIDNGAVKVLAKHGVFTFSLKSVDSLRFIKYTTVIGTKVHYEKAIYIEYTPYLRVMIKPYLDGFIPPLIRMFYNPLIRTKYALALVFNNYEYQHDNFVDPSSIDIKQFVESNHKLAFDRSLIDFTHNEWVKWFGRFEDLKIKVSHIEVCYDTQIPKLDLVFAFQYVGGRAKTIKNSLSEASYSWVDSGLKYYITVNKKIQLKAYTKAWNKNTALNRVEFTVKLNKSFENVTFRDIVGELEETYSTLSKALLDESGVEKIKELLKPIIRCRENCERHYAFWLDLLISGQVKGSTYYRKVAEVYKNEGLIKIKGRGRNSVYTINESLIPLMEKLRELLGLGFRELSIPRIPPNPTDNLQHNSSCPLAR